MSDEDEDFAERLAETAKKAQLAQKEAHNQRQRELLHEQAKWEGGLHEEGFKLADKLVKIVCGEATSAAKNGKTVVDITVEEYKKLFCSKNSWWSGEYWEPNTYGSRAIKTLSQLGLKVGKPRSEACCSYPDCDHTYTLTITISW